MPSNLENSAVATGLEKVSFISIPKKGNAKECSRYNTTALISHASKVTLKILQARLQQYVNRELPDVQAGFWKGRGTRDQIARNVGSLKKQESSRKTSISALLTVLKPLTVWITMNCGKNCERDGNTRPPDLLISRRLELLGRIFPDRLSSCPIVKNKTTSTIQNPNEAIRMIKEKPCHMGDNFVWEQKLLLESTVPVNSYRLPGSCASSFSCVWAAAAEVFYLCLVKWKSADLLLV